MTLTQPALLHIKLLSSLYRAYEENPLLAVTTPHPQPLLTYLLIYHHLLSSHRQSVFLFLPNANEPRVCINLCIFDCCSLPLTISRSVHNALSATGVTYAASGH